MPDLKDYVEIEYSQGKELRRQMVYDKEAHRGVCMSLVIEFVKQLEAGVDIEEIFEKKLDKNLRLAAGRQKIYSSAWKEMSTQSQLLTDLGEHTGIKAKYLGNGENYDPLVTKVKSHPGTHIYLYITFPKGAHAIYAVYIGGATPTLAMFDPNFGLLAAEGNQEIPKMAQALWSKYNGYGMPIQTWRLYDLSLKETIMEKWQKGKIR